MHEPEKAMLENWLKRCLSFKKHASCYKHFNKTLSPIICNKEVKTEKNASGRNEDLNT